MRMNERMCGQWHVRGSIEAYLLPFHLWKIKLEINTELITRSNCVIRTISNSKKTRAKL